MNKIQGNQTPYHARETFFEKVADTYMRLVEGMMGTESVERFADRFMETFDRTGERLGPATDAYLKGMDALGAKLDGMDKFPDAVEKAVEKWL